MQAVTNSTSISVSAFHISRHILAKLFLIILSSAFVKFLSTFTFTFASASASTFTFF